MFETLADLAEPVQSLYPKKMEELGQNYGYLLYHTEASWDADQEKIRIIDGRDRKGYEVEYPFDGLETAFKATVGSGNHKHKM